MTSPDATPATAEPVDPTDADDVDIDFLSADESGVLVGLVTEVYGDTYDAEWVTRMRLPAGSPTASW